MSPRLVQIRHILEGDLELLTLLLLPPMCRDDRRTPKRPVTMLRIELRALWVVGRHCTDWALSPAPKFSF